MWSLNNLHVPSVIPGSSDHQHQELLFWSQIWGATAYCFTWKSYQQSTIDVSIYHRSLARLYMQSCVTFLFCISSPIRPASRKYFFMGHITGTFADQKTAKANNRLPSRLKSYSLNTVYLYMGYMIPYVREHSLDSRNILFSRLNGHEKTQGKGVS